MKIVLASAVFNTFRPGLNQVVHGKTAGSHMVCTSDSNSGAISARELFKHSKSLASLVVCNEKKIFWLGIAGFL